MKIKNYLFLCLLLSALSSVAQLDNSVFYRNVLEDKDSAILGAHIYSMPYFKNNEYGNDVLSGYTLLGYQIAPEFYYKFSDNFTFSLGFFAQNASGRAAFSDFLPLYRLHYNKKGFDFIFGNLYGSLEHDLIEPLYDFENVILNRVEEGFQINYAGRHYSGSVWLDWQQSIITGDNFQERFWIGSRHSLNFINKNQLRASLELQTTVGHGGGEISSYQTPVYSLLNSAVGSKWMVATENKTFLKSFGVDLYYVDARFLGNPIAPYSDEGLGVLGDVYIKTSLLDFTLTYWQSENYFSYVGGFLYDNFDVIQEENNQAGERTFLMLRMTKNIDLAEGAVVSLRLQPYWNFAEDAGFNHNAAFYINLKKNFALKN